MKCNTCKKSINPESPTIKTVTIKMPSLAGYKGGESTTHWCSSYCYHKDPEVSFYECGGVLIGDGPIDYFHMLKSV